MGPGDFLLYGSIHFPVGGGLNQWSGLIVKGILNGIQNGITPVDSPAKSVHLFFRKWLGFPLIVIDGIPPDVFSQSVVYRQVGFQSRSLLLEGDYPQLHLQCPELEILPAGWLLSNLLSDPVQFVVPTGYKSLILGMHPREYVKQHERD
jgi:hypothetical protein